MGLSKLLEEKRSDIMRIAARYGARDIRIFGSAARGQLRPGSDIDVLVSLDPGRTLLDLVAIKQDLEDLLGREIHVVTEAAISPYIRERALKEAVSL